jgi:hypothetical protein
LQMYREAQRLSATGVSAESPESHAFQMQELELANADIRALESLGSRYRNWKQAQDDEIVTSAAGAVNELRIAVERVRRKIQT